MEPDRVRKQFERIGRFRILVIGRANAGKTTILQRVCNTTELPEIFDGMGNRSWTLSAHYCCQRGCHNIRNEFVFRSNKAFIFHDSCGFETGSEDELNKMKEFVVECSSTPMLHKRIHAIWYCIPASEYERPVTAAEERFFNECDTGSVPVIVLLTKTDCLNLLAIQEVRDKDEECDMIEAKSRAVDVEKKLLIDMQEAVVEQLHECKFPPKSYLPLARMNKPECSDQCTKLIMCTTDALDTIALQKLLISTQQTNLSISIQYALKQ
ncbi:hypothetical protein ID866_11142 [Astraeus odoratus]|nr:hypothetical protein ID866_11142 [Astraeus odoratus]